MKTLHKEELLEIYGGGFNFGFWGLIGAAVAFFVGAFDGFVRPSACLK